VVSHRRLDCDIPKGSQSSNLLTGHQKLKALKKLEGEGLMRRIGELKDFGTQCSKDLFAAMYRYERWDPVSIHNAIVEEHRNFLS